MKNPNLIIRSIKIAILVGLILNLINNYDLLFEFKLGMERIIKILLTFLVPFFVSYYSAIEALKNNQ